VSAPEEPVGLPETRAAALLRVRSVWALPAVLAGVVVILMTLIYFGSIVDPVSHLHGLPVLVVNEDVGAKGPTGEMNLGDQTVAALTGTHAISSRLALDVTTLARAKTELGKGADFAAIIIPAEFTSSVLNLVGPATPSSHSLPQPTIQLLTNSRAGTLGVSLATGVLQPALAQLSKSIGQQLLAATSHSTAIGNEKALLAAPVAIDVVSYQPLPDHSGLGLSAFYIALLTTMCGFLGASIINSGVDAALGYATSEVGPWWRQRRPLRITRWQTLLTKWVIALVISPLLSAVMLAVAAGLLRMDAPHLVTLWLFTSCAAIVIAFGTLVLFAALGTLGQLIAMLVFVYLALASSGGTVPLQAESGFYRFVSNFEPLRQILAGVRAILYFNAQADAGLDRGFVMVVVGFAFWIVVGSVVTLWYDRKGFDRMQLETLEFVNSKTTEFESRSHQ
jgi:YhgE/Pip-like protein